MENKKEETLDVIEFIKFRDILRERKIIKNGENLTENLTQFLEISDNIMMIRKLKKTIKVVKNSNYFKYFGIEKKRV